MWKSQDFVPSAEKNSLAREDSIVVAENVPVRLCDVTRSVTYEALNGGDIGLMVNNR